MERIAENGDKQGEKKKKKESASHRGYIPLLSKCIHPRADFGLGGGLKRKIITNGGK